MDLLCDAPLQGLSERDPYFRKIYRINAKIGLVTKDIQRGTIDLRSHVIVVALGNCQIPLRIGENLGTQIKRLVDAIQLVKNTQSTTILVCAILPRPILEKQMQQQVIQANNDINRSVKQMVKFKGLNVKFIHIQHLFLEKIRVVTGHGGWKQMVQVRTPHVKFFKPGTNSLNAGGIFMLRSYLLDEIGVTKNASVAFQIPVKYVWDQEEDENDTLVELDQASEQWAMGAGVQDGGLGDQDSMEFFEHELMFKMAGMRLRDSSDESVEQHSSMCLSGLSASPAWDYQHNFELQN